MSESVPKVICNWRREGSILIVYVQECLEHITFPPAFFLIHCREIADGVMLIVSITLFVINVVTRECCIYWRSSFIYD